MFRPTFHNFVFSSSENSGDAEGENEDMASQQSKRARSGSKTSQDSPTSPLSRPSQPASRAGLVPHNSSRKGYTEGTESSRPAVVEGEKVSSSASSQGGNKSSPRPNSIPQINLVVLGEKGVGKSTFVQCALDLKAPPESRSSTKKMSLEGVIYVVRLLEISVSDVRVSSSGRIVWPSSIGDQLMPTVDGVLSLYDITEPKSAAGFPGILNALQKSALPFVVVSCKNDSMLRSDNPDPSMVEQTKRVLRAVNVHQTAASSPESQKRCISIVLRSILTRTSDISRQHQPSSSRHRSGTTSKVPPPTSSNQPRLHTRATSEIPRSTVTSNNATKTTTTLDKEVDGTGTGRGLNDKTDDSNVAHNSQGSSRYVRSNSHPARPKTPPLGRVKRSGSLVAAAQEDTSPSGRNRHRRQRTSWRDSTSSNAFNTFLDMDDEGDESSQDNSGLQSSSKAVKEMSEEQGPADPGVTFDDLVDRLVAMPMSKQDSKFAAVFLCLYRKFAPPGRLLTAIVTRFDSIDKSSAPQLTRIGDQLRILNIVTQWVSEYPGDFAHAKTRKRLLDFIAVLERNRAFVFAAKEISSYTETTTEDEDAGWAYHDSDTTDSGNVETFLDTSVQSSPATFVARTSEDDAINTMSALDLSEESPDASSTFSNTSSAGRSGSISNQSFSTLLTVENAQREAQMLDLSPKNLLTKFQWRSFMAIPDEEFAREITRIDWVMYSSFRPRDLVRHVSISGQEKDKVKSLGNVNRMIKEFNHLAFFVTSVVLLRDKPKHRAKALEKFMSIAWKLRQQNNYNSLGALIAGINGTPVLRLAQTRELVPQNIQKEFMRLVILMGTQKSHFAYRLAWDNSFSERIPFLPLHRRDLVSAEEGNKTFVGDNPDRINWKKFEVMGDIVLGIQQSQKTPYPYIPRNEEVLRLILDTKFALGEEELYRRSMQVEPSSSADTGRKKFGWLRS
ncbi:hypothetical protein FQN54_005611 [Arachnomyces sp. PD_36]|nr:hypothetical protein FQN54_005611 [Arachnomyces sp. PD_36]